ncbi:hypothetical protein CMO93_05960 [Candidatus Woesearchaeota archaeon]|jgi:predicted HTH domain antitoxin|nr:hypothetical protein [Candidatus Woesearchaeota archaeon]|tara:strand:+ start:619 stop:915 length:297 start_codon:yes stop_codon:yes gene_type:complete
MTIVYPIKIREEIMPLIDLKSKEEHTNKSIVLKQLLYKGLEEYILGLIAKGRLSVGKAAEILDTSIYNIHELAKSKGIKLSASLEQRQKSKEYLTRAV